MAVSVRLDDELSAELEEVAARTGRSKSDVIRDILKQGLAAARAPSAYELGKHVFGRYSSGRTDLSARSEEIAREKSRAKHRRT
jgi:plasmid stability protein